MKVNRYILMVILYLLLASAACTLGTQVTPTPSPATATSAPAATQPLPPNSGTEKIFIQMPGSGSQVVSPLLVEGIAGPTFEQHLGVMLTDISGSTLGKEAAIIQADIGEAGPFNISLEFIISEDRPGRISVYHQSVRDGGLVHLANAPVTLLASGEPALLVEENGVETIQIYEPVFLVEIVGGTLEVSGFSEYFFEGNLSVAVCGNQAGGEVDLVCGTTENLIGEGYATIESPDVGLPGPFHGSVSYAVEGATRGRVVIFALSPMDGQIEHLSSVEVMLNP